MPRTEGRIFELGWPVACVSPASCTTIGWPRIWQYLLMGQVLEPRLTISVSVLATLGSGMYGLLLQVESGQNSCQASNKQPRGGGRSGFEDVRRLATKAGPDGGQAPLSANSGGGPVVSWGAVSEKAGGTVSYLLRTAWASRRT